MQVCDGMCVCENMFARVCVCVCVSVKTEDSSVKQGYNSSIHSALDQRLLWYRTLSAGPRQGDVTGDRAGGAAVTRSP